MDEHKDEHTDEHKDEHTIDSNENERGGLGSEAKRPFDTSAGEASDCSSEISTSVMETNPCKRAKCAELGLDTALFNVGGKVFEVSLVLCKGTKLEILASGLSTSVGDSAADSPIFIDGNSERFAFILDYLRHGQVSLPRTVSKETFLLDLDFFDVQVKDASSIKGAVEFSGVSFLQKIREEELSIQRMTHELHAKRTSLERRKQIMGLASLCFSCLGKCSLAHPKLVLTNFSSEMGENTLVSKAQTTKLLKALVDGHPYNSETRIWFNECLHVYNLSLKSIAVLSKGKQGEINKYQLHFESVDS